MTTRRDFLGTAALAAGGLVSGCATRGMTAARAPAPFYRGALLHLGSNLWDDYPDGPDDWAKSVEEERTRPLPLGAEGTPTAYHCYLQCRDDLWRKSVDRMAEKGLNLLFVDLAEGVEYPSHPELKVAGTWSVEKMRKELARIRALGIEPVPKLNFSTCHDAWLKDYHRMVSTRKYYEVVADVIRDACEIFDGPRFVHLGFDEEVPAAAKNSYFASFRHGDLWWHDLKYTINEVERNGARAVMWSDKICDGREEFLRRMTKNVLLSPWYYGTDFSDKMLAWDSSCEKKNGDWTVQRNLQASFVELDRAGFDLLPCTSNWACREASEALVRFCREKIDPAHLKGIYTAPWKRTIPDGEKRMISDILESIDLFAEAMSRHYPKS